jgi:hypothetical protein
MNRPHAVLSLSHAERGAAPASSTGAALRAYFASDSRRALQTVLGVIWLLDGALQFQSFMYSQGFTTMLKAMEPGQPHWLASSIGWGARFANGNLDVWNTLFALTQVAIGLGLLFRPTVKLALAGSFAWVIVVWWFGEAFGMLFANAANPLTGAPGGVLLYGLIGLIVWPNGRPGGLLGARGARIMWAALWVVMGWLWLLAPNSSANATHDAISGAPSGMSWLNSVLSHAARLTEGNGFLIALILAIVSVAIGVAVGIDWEPRTFLWLAIYLNAIYWILQGFGGLATGSATDPNSGLLFIVLACAVWTTLPDGSTTPARPASTPPAGPPA